METKKKFNQEFAKSIGVATNPPYEFSDSQLEKIIENAEEYSEDERTPAVWQAIVKKHTGINKFLVTEGLDESDIDFWFQRLKDLLKK